LRAKGLLCSTSNKRMFGVAIGLPKFVSKPRQRQAIHNVPNLMKQGNIGTGFFLPRAEAYHNRKPLKTGRGSANMENTCYGDQQCRQKGRQQLSLHGHCAGQQACNRSDTNSTSHGCHDELGLPHEWIY
jgi:hypothetical protein